MKNLNAQTAPRQSQTNSAQIVHKFVSQSFDLPSFKELLTQIFPRIHFTQERKEILQDARLKSYTTLCEPLKLSVLRLSVGVFECENIRAKISIHTELKELLKKSNLNAILAVFYAPKQSEFRLSLITSGFDYETNKASFSNLKRQSFILGHDKTATAQRVLLKLIDTAQNLNATRNSSTISSENLSLKDLENAFSQEPISKEFYKDITACFLDFLSSVKLPANVSENDKRSFVLRLLCRLLFCKFLEKKGLIKAEIWDTGLSKNYYFEILQTLFFATLNTEPNLRDENELYTLLTPEIKALLSAVPYLNGGLFSPQKNDFFNPDKPFVYLHELSLPNSAFDKLFELFHQYNFTLDEQSAFDTEVALDPELLGTVFESLLCELFTESKGKDLTLSLRKSTGSYYTPREIVSYMVKSALLEQLKLKMGDEKGLKEFIFDDNVLNLSNNRTSDILRALKELKILDPACGSGAFPMGILNEILHLQEKCGDDRSHYERKLEILQNCIYGVDIQPMATEITRLRCFLSLIIDEDINDIKPLPNLEFKFISANSLLPLSADASLHYDGYHKDIQELERLRNEYFNSQDKTAIQKQYLNLRERITREDLQVNKNDSINNPMLAYDPFDPQSVAQFFDSAYMFGVESFDIVIGNPPYGAKIDDIANKIFKNTYKHATQGSLDTYKLFIEKGFDLLAKNGNLSYIVPLTVTSSKSNIQLHKMLLDNCEWIEVSSYGDRPAKIFGNAEQKVSIISFAKTLTHCKELMTTWVNKRNAIQSIQSVLHNLRFTNSIDFVREGAFCKISLPIEKFIMQKLYTQKQMLKDIMNGDERIYYRDTGNRYYNLFTTYSTTNSTTQKSFEVRNSNAIVALMSSNLFWWFKNAYTEGKHSYIYEFEPFPIPKLSEQMLMNLDKLGKKLQADIESKANFTSTGTKEYRLRKSKHIIDEIDRLICPLYDLTPEETEFIINYELKFRTDS